MSPRVSVEVVQDLAPLGTLRAAINLGNPVLAQGTPSAPRGVSVDIAHELGARLGVPVDLSLYQAARDSFESMKQGHTDICFLAVDPAREGTVAFTAPYAVVDGVFAVHEGTPIRTLADVDQPGVRVGVKKGSAYDLFLSRTLTHADVVRGADGVIVFDQGESDVAAGLRQPVHEFAATRTGIRVLRQPFMQIRQAMGTTTDRREETLRFLRDFIEELKTSGFVGESLRRSGRSDAVIPPRDGE